jgi:hypothetical protein
MPEKRAVIPTIGKPAPQDSRFTPDYERARRRLQSIDDLPAAIREEAWTCLVAWQHHVRAQHGQELPAPWVFANEQDVVEFEWEIAGRFLMVRLNPGGQVDYLKSEEVGGKELDEEGTESREEVTELLRWLLRPA